MAYSGSLHNTAYCGPSWFIIALHITQFIVALCISQPIATLCITWPIVAFA